MNRKQSIEKKCAQNTKRKVMGYLPNLETSEKKNKPEILVPVKRKVMMSGAETTSREKAWEKAAVGGRSRFIVSYLLPLENH